MGLGDLGLQGPSVGEGVPHNSNNKNDDLYITPWAVLACSRAPPKNTCTSGGDAVGQYASASEFFVVNSGRGKNPLAELSNGTYLMDKSSSWSAPWRRTRTDSPMKTEKGTIQLVFSQLAWT